LTKLILDKKKILEYQQNRSPYLFIDYAEVESRNFANGYKELKSDEWFFKVHWPNDPNMPGALQMESMVQMAALMLLTAPNQKGKLVYLISTEKLELKKKVVPNNKMYIKTKMLKYNRGIAQCAANCCVDDQIMSNSLFTILLPDELKKFTKKNAN
jgi:3-hydroxyacyl-[acyl-carrier-protein] dehydratase